MNEHLKFALTNIWQTLLAFYTGIIIALVVMFTIQGGWFEFSSGNNQTPHSTYYLEVAADGASIYTGAENVSDALRKVIMQEVYPSPDAAFDAVLEPLPGNPAEAHAVLLCTTRDGVISQQTSNSYHETYHRFDRDGYRYTKTYHVIWSGTGYVIDDVFYGKINKKYC